MEYPQSMDQSTGNCVFVPVLDSYTAVKLDLDNLPEDPKHITNLLQGELAPLELWIRVAVQYWKDGSIENFKEIVDAGTDKEVEKHYPKQIIERNMLLNLKAAYFLNRAREKSGEERVAILEECVAVYNQCNKLGHTEPMTFVGTALTMLTKGQQDMSLKTLDIALAISANCVPALLAKAHISYAKGEHAAALKLYRDALRVCGSAGCPAEVRLGIGFCLMKLRRPNQARKAFEIVLKMTSNSNATVSALLCLSVIELNAVRLTKQPSKRDMAPHERAEFDTKEREKRKIQAEASKRVYDYLERAYSINPKNPLVLCYMADRYFFYEDYHKAREFSKLAQKYAAKDSDIFSFATYQQGKAYHAQSHYESASKKYRQSDKKHSNVLSLFGLAQTHLLSMFLSERDEEAMKCLNLVLESCPHNFPALKAMGCLNNRQGELLKARDLLNKALDVNDEDVETWILLASVCEQFDRPTAITAYTTVIRLMKERRLEVPLAVYNNIAVLFHQTDQFDKAQTLYGKLLERLRTQQQGDRGRDSSDLLSVMYNQARLFEDEGYFRDAHDLYTEILGINPRYTDCHLRLGIMAQKAGRLDDGEIQFQKARDKDEKNMNALSYLGELYMSRGDTQKAKEMFNEAVKIDKTDAYNLLSLGNMYISAMNAKTPKTKDDGLRKAWGFFKRVMELEPRNMFAANAIGVLLAERGFLNEAKSIFLQVREATSTMPEVWINLGHILVSEGNYDNAVTMYAKAIRCMDSSKSAIVQLYLARAYYLGDKMKECKAVLQQALLRNPRHEGIWYNLALAQEEFAIGILKKDPDKRFYEEVEQADRALRQAHLIFKRLLTSENRDVPNEKCEKHANYCGSQLKNSESHLLHAKSVETRREKERREKLARTLVSQKKRMEVEEEIKKVDEEKLRKKAKLAEESKSKLLEMKENWAAKEREIIESEMAAKEKKKRTKKEEAGINPYAKPRPTVNDMFAEYGSEESGEDEEFEPAPDKMGDHDINPMDDAEDVRFDGEDGAQAATAGQAGTPGQAGIPGAVRAETKGSPQKLKKKHKKKRKLKRLDDEDVGGAPRANSPSDGRKPPRKKRKKRRAIDDEEEEGGPSFKVAAAAVDAVEPRTDIEHRMAKVITTILNVDPDSISDISTKKIRKMLRKKHSFSQEEIGANKNFMKKFIKYEVQRLHGV
eukprot:630226_1